MSDAVTIALIAGAPGMLASILSFLNQRHIVETKRAVMAFTTRTSGPDPQPASTQSQKDV